MELNQELLDELRTCLRLQLTPGLTSNMAKLLLSHFGFSVFDRTLDELKICLTSQQARELVLSPLNDVMLSQIEQSLEWAARDGNYLISLADPHYPAEFLSMADAPILLYAKGNIACLQRPKLAIVGARQSTVMGSQIAHDFAACLAERFCVVSGLARGIDMYAHEGALSSNVSAATIAVMATGMNYIYPAQNRDLAYRIASAGLLLSEYPLDTRVRPYHFPLRNRLITGLSQGVLVVEATLKSGSLLTARLAMEMNRDVFAIPGSIHSPQSRGCHALIKQGAKLVESANDILDELGYMLIASSPRQQVLQVEPLSEQEQHLLTTMGYDALNIEQLLAYLETDFSTLSQQLLSLEVRGYIQRLPDGRYQRQSVQSSS